MFSYSRRLLAGTILGVTVSLAVVACSPAPGSPSSAPPTIQHIHDIVFSSNGDLLIGSHDGVYAVELDTGDTSLVGDVAFDSMGLAAQGETIFVSGHPGADNHDSFVAPHIGLVKHTVEVGWEQRPTFTTSVPRPLTLISSLGSPLIDPCSCEATMADVPSLTHPNCLRATSASIATTQMY